MKRAVLPLLFLSGACGLVYEVVWTRMMTHVFGGTALAIGTVLAAYMTGLAIGSWLLGRMADRVRRPLRIYGYLEAGIALTAAAAHFLLTQITPAYIAVYEAFGRSDAALAIARFFMAFVLIVAPTALMGATLPLLARFMIRSVSAVGASVSTLYAVNTMGAVAGALAAGFMLIKILGVHGAVAAAILGNAAIGCVAWVVSYRAERAPAMDPTLARPRSIEPQSLPQPLTTATRRLVLAGLAISGMTSFAYEVYWARCLHFITGNSTYAVTITLVAFLTGIALGGYLIRFAMRPGIDAAEAFGWTQVLIAAFAAMAMPGLFTLVESETVRAHTWGVAGGFWSLTMARFGVAFVAMSLPAALIGATFPLASRIGVTQVRETGAAVGRVYAINTVGNVLGALLPGLVLIHWLGLQTGILVMATLNLLVGFCVLASRIAEVKHLRWASPAAVAVIVLAVSGIPLAFPLPLAAGGPWYRVLYQRDGPAATTAVLLHPETREKSMTVDGVAIGGTGVTDYKQQILAHLPKLLVDDVSNELSVGLGSGLLIGESARHARVKHITCVEIEPTVVEGSAWFARESHRIAENPAVRIVVDDVANYLRTTPASYNVVSADEKTADEFASNGFSYSRDYYEMIRTRLDPGGLVIQWVPTDLPPRQYRMILKSFSTAFPHVLMWYFGPALMSGTSNTILVGSNDRIEPDLRRANRWMAADSAAYEGLARYGLRTPEIVFAQFWTGRDALVAAVAADHENTLSHPRYEFYSPRDYAVPSRQRLAENFDFLMRLRGAAPEPAFSDSPSDSARGGLMRELRAAEGEYLTGCGLLLHGAPPSDAVRHLERALALAPWNENLRARVFAQYWELAGQFLAVGNLPAAVEFDRLGLRAYDRNAMSHVEYALLLQNVGSLDQAIASARRGLALDPELVAARSVLAAMLLRTGRVVEAQEHLRAILAVEPDHDGARRLLGNR